MGRRDYTSEEIQAYAESAHQLTVRYHEVIQGKVISVVESMLNRTDHEESLVSIFYRMHLLMRTLAKLSQPEDFQTVRSTSRSLYELLLDFKYLASDNSLAVSYWAFVDVERMRSAIQVNDFVATNPTPELSKAHRAAITLATSAVKIVENEEVLKRVWGITTDIKVDRARKFPKSWSRKSVRQLAESLGGSFVEDYFAEYPISSWFAHGGFVGVGGMSNQQIVNLFGRSHILAQGNYLKAIFLLVYIFRLFDAVPGLRESLRELEDSQGDLLISNLIRNDKRRGQPPTVTS